MLKFLKRLWRGGKKAPVLWIPLSFFLTEVFAFLFLGLNLKAFASNQLWPLAFAALWSVILGTLVLLPSAKIGRCVYAVVYFLGVVYAGFQTGYYILFSEMMWLSEFLYASEGSDYASVLLGYPLGWWLGILALIIQGIWIIGKFPSRKRDWKRLAAAAVTLLLAVSCIQKLPERIFLQDSDEAETDFKRAKSAEAVYENMFNVHRLYQLCGLYQCFAKDVYTHEIYPLTPGYLQEQEKARTEIEAYFAQREDSGDNQMTGILEGKNVILVLMESLDDWMLGEHTPAINRLMEEGISFTRFYTPVYGGIRTFNSEFCMNTGSFLSSQGGYAFDYVTNSYVHSLPSLLTAQGYSAKTFHYNSPSFYSRGEFSPAMGYDEYLYFADYMEWGDEETNKRSEELFGDDCLVFDNEKLNAEFFREGSTLNFLITNSAHLPYKYSDKQSILGLKRYPQYQGLTGDEETDCAYLKAKLLDDMFARLMVELEEKGQLENTVIIGVSDHYTYGFEDKQKLLELSNVEDMLLLERTPCFIWSADLAPMEVCKVLNTSDLLPTVLNMLGVDSPYSYMGHDAFDDGYDGFVPFSDGSWISADIAYNASTGKYMSLNDSVTVTEEFKAYMTERVQEYIRINNLILESDYYK